jgi:predicted site-specific integrase-resolvase
MEETFTDKEFCRILKIDRATSLRWREKGIIKFLKLPNGQIRYTPAQIDEFWERAKKLAALQNVNGADEGRVVNIGVAKRG